MRKKCLHTVKQKRSSSLRAVGKDFTMRLRGWKGIDKGSEGSEREEGCRRVEVNNTVEWDFFTLNIYETKNLRRQQLFEKTVRRI